MKFDVVVDGFKDRLSVESLGENLYRIGEKEIQVDVAALQDGVYSLIIEGRSYEVSVRDEKKGMIVEVGPHFIPVKLVDPFKAKAAGAADVHEGEALITSPMPGRVIGLKVTVGQEVKAGEGIVVVEAMKMENELSSPKDGKVKRIDVKLGDTVESGQDLVVIE